MPEIENEHAQHENSQIDDSIFQLIESCGKDANSTRGQLVTQIIQTGLRLLSEDYDLGEVKVINRSIKEMRYAYRIFDQYKKGPCVSIFGSARTPEEHPDYLRAKEFSAQIAKQGWMCITGAANGIMKAGMEGPPKDKSFGLSIRLPFESTSNSLIEGDPKLITFRYFFTRKLMFMSQSNAMVAFPGGFGTLDELFEMLTLMQTGKSNIIPVVLMEGIKGVYWTEWLKYVKLHLEASRWISPEDEHFFHIAPTSEEAVSHILKFYSRYHSSRYVRDLLVIRLLSPLTEDQIKILNKEFIAIIASGSMTATEALPEENDFLELPRLVFHHTRRNFSQLRMLIDAINNF